MKSIFILLVIAVVSFGCKKKKDEVQPTPTVTAELKKAVVENYASIVYASYQDAYTRAKEMKQKAQTFLDTPSDANFKVVKDAWLASRVPYELTEAYRFYGGPIDDDNGPEPFLNAWPMDEAFVDYVDGKASVGIINDAATYPVIDKDLLTSLNTSAGETNISAGYHVIEFLLWGQDLYTDSPGKRPYTDYVTGAGGTAANQGRRGQYLMSALDLLVDDLSYLVDAWKPNASNNYRSSFVANSENSLKLIFTGMGKFAKGELAGERMTVAYESQDQEDEHSCFSDNTDNDIKLGQNSIYNVYIGKYTRIDGSVIDGSGIDDLVKVQHADLNTAMIAALDAATSATTAIQAPFDQEITDGNPGGRSRVLTAINAIKAEADKLVEVATSLGISLVI